MSTTTKQDYPIGLTPIPVDQTTDQKQRRMVLKHQNQFLLLDLQGGMAFKNGAGLGLYVNDTRFLNRWELKVGGQPLHFLSADADRGYAASITYCNKALDTADGAVPEGSITLMRELVLDESEIVSEKITLHNHLKRRIELPVSLAFAADFADMFQVRGDVRLFHGYLLASQFGAGKRSVTLRYLGRDNILRRTRINFTGLAPHRLDGTVADFNVSLEPLARATIQTYIRTAEKDFEPGKDARLDLFENVRPVVNHGRRFDFAPLKRGDASSRADAAFKNWEQQNCRISSDNPDFNRFLERSQRDIYLLRQQTPVGRAIAAGVPWFAVPFGRDSLVAGLQTLPFMPELSKEIIIFLAAYQGKKYDEATCEKPGRIMHELRPGEMAGLAEIPFRPYYGTVDATQLWLMLFARYVQWTGDLTLARKLFPNVRAALFYLSQDKMWATYGGTGALTNQGWKDSGNCVVYSNGELAKGPIAICEAQGYLYAAWNEVADVAMQLGFDRTAAQLKKQAADLKKRFNRDFWMEAEGTTALALDGEGKQCDVVASNAGHLLGTGILSPEREKRVAERLMRDDMFSGWGIRTLADSARAYHPTDYQVGAVWPHDNGMIAHGMYVVGEAEKAHRVTRAMLDVALSQSDLRLPELFAGFKRDQARQPVPYQVACIPQLWAAGCGFHMIAGMVGLSYDSQARLLKINRPSLPSWINHLKLEGLTVGDSIVNLDFYRNTASGATTVEVTRINDQVRCLVEH